MIEQYKPLSLLAEVTYRCNLQCPYCYNPLDLAAYGREMDVAAWERIIDQAAELGIMQIHFSGGEPTLRPDLVISLIRRARSYELYTNLITQGTFINEELLKRMLDAGLEHMQISLQAAQPKMADYIAGTKVHERKLESFKRVLQRELAVTLNCVLHRSNIDEVEDIIALAEHLGVRRLELANTQFYGWAYKNRFALVPTKSQVERAKAAVTAAQTRLRGRMEITHVLSDYYEQFPKPCMSGWARQFMTVTPDGRVLPCPAAAAITTLRFDNVEDKPLKDIWYNSAAFNAYRGTSWMPEPCRSCPRKNVDFGGCRCQAFLLAGDAGVTDPVCVLSPLHGVVEDLRPASVEAMEFVPRRIQR